MGTLCTIDSQPHYDFSEEDEERLRELARSVQQRPRGRCFGHVATVALAGRAKSYAALGARVRSIDP